MEINPNKLNLNITYKDALTCKKQLPTDVGMYYIKHYELCMKNPEKYQELFSFLYPGKKGIESLHKQELVLAVEFCIQVLGIKYKEHIPYDPTNGLIFFSYLVCNNRNENWLTEKDIFELQNHTMFFRIFFTDVLKSVDRIHSYRHLFIDEIHLGFLNYVIKNINCSDNLINQILKNNKDKQLKPYMLTTIRETFNKIGLYFNINVKFIEIFLNLDHTHGLLLLKYLVNLNTTTEVDKKYIEKMIDFISTCVLYH